jgi:chaperonin GroES
VLTVLPVVVIKSLIEKQIQKIGARRSEMTVHIKESKTMKIRPLHDRVIVKRLEEERKTASGIVIPDAAAEKPDQGEVISVGAGKILEDGKVRPMSVKVGERVLFGKYSGQSVKIDGQELLVMREEDIMGVVEA